MTKKLQLLSLLAFLLISDGLSASIACMEFFASHEQVEKPAGTDDLIAYLGVLLEQQIIGETELQRIIAGLEEGEFVNPILEQRALANTAALLHRNEIQEYLDATELDQEEILRWVKQKLIAREGGKVRRGETRVETEDVHYKMAFYPIPPGKFEMGKGKTVSVELTHTIEMMSTLVTQKHWIDLMGDNPSYFKGLDNPVEKVSWWSAIFFANELSKKHGLKPAYDLSEVELTGDASKGTLTDVKGKIKINAPGGDIYLAEGYRLPTEAEQEYVRRNLGKATGDYYFGNNEAELKKHAWYCENSNLSTHPVAELKPLMIGGSPFFDLLGNVSEWGHDYYDDLKGGINPVGASGSARVIRGGGWGYVAQDCRSANRDLVGPDYRNCDVGFRLLRTLP